MATPCESSGVSAPESLGCEPIQDPWSRNSGLKYVTRRRYCLALEHTHYGVLYTQPMRPVLTGTLSLGCRGSDHSASCSSAWQDRPRNAGKLEGKLDCLCCAGPSAGLIVDSLLRSTVCSSSSSGTTDKENHQHPVSLGLLGLLPAGQKHTCTAHRVPLILFRMTLRDKRERNPPLPSSAWRGSCEHRFSSCSRSWHAAGFWRVT